MASYDEWNHALLSYFTQGISRGSSVYLNVDDDVLYQVGRDLLPSSVTRSSEPPQGFGLVSQLSTAQHASADRSAEADDLCRAVRRCVVDSSDRVRLDNVRGRNARGEPKGLAFLCAMVLAASRMAEEEDVSSANYFRRLRETLGLSSEDGRLDGMRFGAEAEEPLWREWGRWLQENELIPSARRGEGPSTYISYPISQTLLRRADKDRLVRLFVERQWLADWDVETLLSRVQREAASLSHHLEELLASGEQRFRAVADAIYDVHELWKEDPQSSLASHRRNRNAHLMAGLYRVEDPFSGQVAYHIYPRQARRWASERIVVEHGGTHQGLIGDRPGWYEPLWVVGDDELEHGVRYCVQQPAELESLVLPERAFWLLVPDPDNPDSGVYASWQSPTLGTHFVLLFKMSDLPQMQKMRNEKLIAWSGDPVEVSGYSGWLEIRDCMVVSEDWPSNMLEHRDLYEALRPRISLNISLNGGLRVRGLAGWIEGHGPQISVIGFDPTAEVSIIAIANERVVLEHSVTLNEPFLVEWPGPGTYRVEATCNGETAPPRLVKLTSWQKLHMIAPAHREGIKLGNMRICGAALVSEYDTEGEGNAPMV